MKKPASFPRSSCARSSPPRHRLKDGAPPHRRRRRSFPSASLQGRWWGGEIGAGDGHLSLVAARAVAPSGRVFATELGGTRVETLKRNAETAGVKNVEVVEARTEVHRPRRFMLRRGVHARRVPPLDRAGGDPRRPAEGAASSGPPPHHRLRAARQSAGGWRACPTIVAATAFPSESWSRS